eukprot:9281668-Pyramimonas_sp.AAC.1
MFYWCKQAGWEFVDPARVRTPSGVVCNVTLAPPAQMFDLLGKDLRRQALHRTICTKLQDVGSD